MFVDGPFQRMGIGTEVMGRLIGEATAFNLAVRLNVVRINPARRLYERLGFRITHEDDRKFYMKRDAMSFDPDYGPTAKSSAIPALPWFPKPRLRYSPGLAPTTRLNALLNAASDS